MINTNVYTFLSTQSGIIALTTANRIWREILPSKPVYPAITFGGNHNLPNTFEGNTGFTISDYTIDAWADSDSGAESLAKEIRSALKNVTGSFGGINIHQCLITTGPITVYEESVEAFRQSQIFTIWHNEG